MRVFTAVDIENPETLQKLKDLQEEVDYRFNKVKPEKMHLTLQFFQDIDREEVEEIKKGLSNVEIEPFEMKIKGVGVFPSRDHVRVVWAGIESEEIFELKEEVSNHKVEEDNNHDFHPHVTLARVHKIGRNDKKEFRQKLEEHENTEIGRVEVDSVKLFESVQTGNGTRYKVLEEETL